MKYYEYTFIPVYDDSVYDADTVQDVLSALLAEIGFESFVRTADLSAEKVVNLSDPENPTFKYADDRGEYRAYIQQSLHDEEALRSLLEDFPLPGVEITYTQAEPEDKDWNAEWEQNYFQPILVEAGGHTCSIASTFHKNVPGAEYAIRIDPRMSFGTGHHQTTSQMISRILETDMVGKEVLDMGCGTSILAILARMRGAAHCWGVDVDEWCVENSIDNIALNSLDGVDVVLGDATTLAKLPKFHLVIANINRNILLQDMPAYVDAMLTGAEIFMSGFYTEDVAVLREKAASLGLTFMDERSRDNWACIRFKKD